MRVIYVDDESPAIDNFRLTVEDLSEINTLQLFTKSEDALQWAENNPVDVAFVDIEMPIINGIELAKRLKQIDRNIRIIFVTAFEQYALQAFQVEAIGYLLKPYTREEVQNELEKATFVHSRPKKKIVVQTIPNFAVLVNGKPIYLERAKTEELLALLVDRAEAGITAGEAMACIWPEKAVTEKNSSLYRVTFHRLISSLKEEGIDYIIGSKGRKKYIKKDLIDCDLYRILDGDIEALQNYGGVYMNSFSWAEERNGQLTSMKETLKKI